MSTTGADRASRRYDLDFVRGVAILLALGWHFNLTDTGLLLVDWLQLPGRLLGWAGVDLFFVLSGFLVGGLLLKELKATGAFDAKRFAIRRVFKIWPVLYAYAALLVLSGRYPWQDVLPQVLFHIQNYWLTPAVHLWSLAVEEHFYAAMALLLLWRCGRIKGGDPRIESILLVLILLVFVARCAAVLLGLNKYAIQYQTQFRIDSLAVGVLLASWYHHRPALFAKMVGRKWALLGVVTFAVVVLILFRAEQAFISSVGYSVAYLGAAAFLLFVFGLPALNGGAMLGRAVSWIGSYSYPIYVFQFVAYRIVESAWGRWFGGVMSPSLELFVKYACGIAFAVAASKLIEHPMIALRNRLFPSNVAAY